MPGPTRPSASASAGRDRVLASPSRARVLAVVVDHPGGIDAGRIAPAVGLHVNTVRAHLEILEHAGFVRSEPEDRHHRGRPRRLFRAVAAGDDPGLGDERNAADVRERDEGGNAYRDLAAALAAAVHDPSPDRAGAAAAAGARWGQQLAIVDASATGLASGPLTVPAVRSKLRDLLEQLGFAPAVVAADRIELRRCPFLDVAREHPEVVCGLHRGMLAGVLESLGHDGGIELEPFTTPTTCDVRFGDPLGSAA